jgi:hypothetical protein
MYVGQHPIFARINLPNLLEIGALCIESRVAGTGSHQSPGYKYSVITLWQLARRGLPYFSLTQTFTWSMECTIRTKSNKRKHPSRMGHVHVYSIKLAATPNMMFSVIWYVMSLWQLFE